MRDTKGYYTTLCITDKDRKTLSSDAMAEKLKKNFRKISIEHHPDKFANEDEATRKFHEETFKKANEAYTILSDPDKKRQYDLECEVVFGGNGGYFHAGFNDWTSGMNVDPFEYFKKGGFWEGRHESDIFGGGDIKIGISVSLEEVINGSERSILINREVRKPDGNTQKLVLVQETEKIKIPVGVIDGQILRFDGRGSEAKAVGGKNGALLVKVSIKEHPKYKRQDRNLTTDLEINMLEAWDGTDKTIETLSGKKLKLKIPALTPYGKLFRIPNCGLPDARMGGAGDLFVRIVYKEPKTLTQRQVDLLREFYDIEEKKTISYE